MKSIQEGLVRATLSAADAGIAPDVNAKNWYWGPGNHWSYQHTNRIFPSADIARGSGPVTPLAYALRDLGRFSQMVLQGSHATRAVGQYDVESAAAIAIVDALAGRTSSDPRTSTGNSQ